MTGKWSNFRGVWWLYAGTTMMGMSISTLLTVYFIQNGTELDNFSLAFIYGLPLGVLQLFFLGGRTILLVFATIVGFYIGFLISTLLGHPLPRELGSLVVGAAVGLGQGTIQTFFVIHRRDHPLLGYAWMFVNLLGWSLGFWITHQLGTDLYRHALVQGAQAQNAIYPSVAIGAFLGGAVTGTIIGFVFSLAHPKPDYMT
jgi:hypothetical protein